METMKTLFITHEASQTGAPLALLAILKSFKKDNNIQFDVIIIRDGELHKEFSEVADNVFSFYKSPDNRLKTRIIRRFKRFLHIKDDELKFLNHHDYDLIYANTIASLWLGCSIKKRIGKPLIAHIHESEFLLSTYKTEKTMFLMCDKIISVSSLSKDALINKYSIPSSLISVIYPFSPYIDYQNKSTIPYRQDTKESFKIGLSGYCCWVKGTDLLPQVIKRWSELHPNIDAQFIWVGQKTENFEIKLKYELDKLGLQKYLYLAGATNTPMTFFKEFDIFLLLSREDSFPLVALENAYLGKPIISMKGASGINDLLQKEAGIIVPYLSIDGIVNAIYKLYTDKELAKKIGQKAQQLVLTQFNKENSIEAIKNLILNR